MRSPLEVTSRTRGQRFMGSSIADEPLYRVPRTGVRLIGTEPIPLFSSTETLANPTNADTFDAGVRFYEMPPTLRKISKAWKGGLLANSHRLTRVLDDEGEPLREETDIGVFCLFQGIPDMGPKWIDIQRVTQPTKRKSR